ncbi:hypothetical protein MRB53_041783 [Persea americana]|nr:hypothetical protein MRB53_041783 [Persea americana]
MNDMRRALRYAVVVSNRAELSLAIPGTVLHCAMILTCQALKRVLGVCPTTIFLHNVAIRQAYAYKDISISIMPENTDPKASGESPAPVKDESAKEGTLTEKANDAAAGMKSNVFSMFGGGAKKEKKEDVDEENDRSGSSKQQKATADVSHIMHCNSPLTRFATLVRSMLTHSG